jgi:centromere protein C
MDGADRTLCRRTGVTLKDTGIRDEHGLEPIEGIFSSPEKSPEKSPTRSNGAAKNSTINTEEEMDIGNSIHLESLRDCASRRI